MARLLSRTAPRRPGARRHLLPGPLLPGQAKRQGGPRDPVGCSRQPAGGPPQRGVSPRPARPPTRGRRATPCHAQAPPPAARGLGRAQLRSARQPNALRAVSWPSHDDRWPPGPWACAPRRQAASSSRGSPSAGLGSSAEATATAAEHGARSPKEQRQQRERRQRRRGGLRAPGGRAGLAAAFGRRAGRVAEGRGLRRAAARPLVGVPARRLRAPRAVQRWWYSGEHSCLPSS